MTTIINAGTTSTTGLNITTDTSGALAIQTSGANAISISTSQVVTLTNALLPASGGTGITSLGTGVATFLGTPSSANLAAALTDETGTGVAVFGTAPTISSPTLTGTPVAPTASAGTNTTQVATTAFVTSAVAAAPIPAGTVMLFYQAGAPIGWTQVTSLNDYGLRLVSGTGGTTAGTTAFSTVFTNQTPTISNTFAVGSTTLSTSQIPSHTHQEQLLSATCCAFTVVPVYATSGAGTGQPSGLTAGGNGNGSPLLTVAEGGGGSHTHSLSGSATSSAITLNVRYANIIICSKN